MLIGNLTRDPELRVTPKGTSICQFGLAVNRTSKDETGAQRDETTFIDLEAWGKTADLIAKYLSKGSPAYFEGRLKLDQWEDKQSGQKRSKIKVVVDAVQFLGAPPARREQGSSEYQGQQPPQHTSRDTAPHKPAPTDIDEDVPF